MGFLLKSTILLVCGLLTILYGDWIFLGNNQYRAIYFNLSDFITRSLYYVNIDDDHIEKLNCPALVKINHTVMLQAIIRNPTTLPLDYFIETDIRIRLSPRQKNFPHPFSSHITLFPGESTVFSFPVSSSSEAFQLVLVRAIVDEPYYFSFRTCNVQFVDYPEVILAKQIQALMIIYLGIASMISSIFFFYPGHHLQTIDKSYVRNKG
jgi:hypothetical protein